MAKLQPLILAYLVFGSFAAQAPECSLYLAESSIPNAGWGVFAGKNFTTGDPLEQPGIGIPVIDAHRLGAETVLLQYLWRSSVSGGFHEADEVSNFLPGVGTLANYHAALNNVVEGGLALDSAAGGASTAYHNFSFLAAGEIQAGDEIFAGAGLLVREAQLNDYPNRQDYNRAQELVDGLVELRDKQPQRTDIEWIDILHRLQNEMLASESDEGVKQLLPQTVEELLLMKEKGAAKGLLEDRDLKWIQQHGYCLDNLRDGTSTIEGAGRGAFATRSIDKGSLVAPAPLIPVNASVFVLEHRGPDNHTVQLLGNYCFGNIASVNQMLLCPLSQIGLMNHKLDNPNAAIRWGKPSKNRRDADVNLLLKNWSDIKALYRGAGSKTNAPLMFEVYALEEINEGDEIFLDYTVQWDDAFAEHSRAKEYSTPKSASQGIDYVTEEQDVALSEDLSPAVTYQCRIEPLAKEESRGDVEEEDYRGRPYQYPERLSDFLKTLFLGNENAMWHACNIIGTNDGGETFRAIVHSKARTPQRLMRRYQNLPRSALRIVPGAYQSEQHHPESFRHFVPIPNSLFPARWRNDYVRSQDLHLGVIDFGIDVSAPENIDHHALHEKKVREAKCGAYFAPSNIPEAGFSQYTAVPYAGSGLSVGSFMPAIIIPRLFKNNHEWGLHDYVWEGKTYGAEYEIGQHKTTEVLSASLANFHPGILNMKLRPSILHPLLDSCKDPGAGASTDYVGGGFTSSRALSGGEELFISYGDAWFISRKDLFGDIAVSTNYAESNGLLASIWALTSVGDEPVLEKDEVFDVISFAKKNIVNNPRTLSALQKVNTWQDLERVVSRNGTALATMDLRSLEWLEEHGQCMDHIFVKESTIRQAGHGAFARRSLVEGATIISSPMIHVWGREMMEMNVSLVDEEVEINPTFQLLNYQFSHPESSVYFVPINQMIGINHNSDRSDAGQTPNAKLQWATWNTKSLYALQRPLEDLKKERYSTLVMDVVATRDIQPDEEVFIDYGEEWEVAWGDHVQNWKPCQQGRLSTSVISEMNNDKHNSAHHEWSTDHFTVCQKNDSTDFETVYITPDIPTGPFEGLTVTDDYKGIKFGDEGFKYSSFQDRRHPCKIRKVDAENIHFEAILFFSSSYAIEVHRTMHEKNIEFIPKPYKSDMHLPGAFRHEIKIPNDIFPNHWMDLAI